MFYKIKYTKTIVPFLLFAAHFLYGQSQEARYQRLTIETGLPDENIRHIMQDRRGFMWFATANGVARYDGHKFKIFQCHPFDDYSLSACSTQRLYEDKLGNIWVTTVDYLNLFDPVKERFIRLTGLAKYGRINVIYQSRSGEYYIGTETSGLVITRDITTLNDEEKDFIHLRKNGVATHSLSSDSISTIYEDRLGYVWIGTKGGGLNRLNPIQANDQRVMNLEVNRYSHDPKNQTSLSHNIITAMTEDSSGCLWVGTANGLNQVAHLETSGEAEFIRYGQKPYNQSTISHSFIRSLRIDQQGNLWVGTANGLDKLAVKIVKNKEANLPVQWTNVGRFHFKTAQNNLRTNSIVTILQDDSGILWLGSDGAGVYKLNDKRPEFHVLKLPFTHDNNDEVLSSVTSLFMADHGVLWVGTERGSLIKLSPEAQQNPKAVIKDYQGFHLKGGFIYSIFNADKEHLMIGTKGGLLKFNKLTGTSMPYGNRNGRPFEGLPVYQIIRDSRDFIWLATDEGLHRIQQGKITSYLPNSADRSSLAWPKVWTVYEDRQGFIWIGTKLGGISRLDSQTGEFINHQYNSVNSIYQDNSDTMWFGSYSGGLSKLIFVEENGFKLKHYFVDNGLPSNRIQSIVGDDGYLWLSTGNGLSKFDPETERFRNYSVSNWLQGARFNRASFWQSSTGELFFGGTSGLNRFYPAEIKESLNQPQIVLTEFKKQGQKITFEKSVSEVDRIDLSYNDTVITFEFAALDYARPEKNQFAYRLDGFNEDWVYCGNQNTATFTNLKPGNYSFRVKASNSYGIWNEQGIAIDLSVAPPWWQSWWFRGLVFFSLLTIVGTIYRVRVKFIEKQKKDLEKLIAERTFELHNQKQMAEEAKHTIEQQAQKLIKADQMKSRFFANISHEFRTPLSLIISPLKDMLARNGTNGDSKHLKVMHRNSQRLLMLINQLLEISKIETGDMKLQAEGTDLVAFLQPVFDSFLSEAERKKIEYKLIIQHSSPVVSIDKEKFEKVIYNLLSNAFKFTPDGGQVTLTIGRNNGHLNIKVSDTGIGIPPEQLQFIFNRFYQIDNSSTRAFEGTGLGLALSKELVTLHGGTIQVTSEQGKGSEFIVGLPVLLGKISPESGKQKNGTIVTSQNDNATGSLTRKAPISNNGHSLKKQHHPNGKHSMILALIEDNQDIVDYLSDHFSEEYEVVTANNGQTGLDLVRNTVPDIVICDVMMPEKDGYQVCNTLKQDEKTCHIPIFMLTAKAGLENKLDGLAVGADAYVTKPFEIKEIKARIKNLIEQRRKLKEQYSRQVYLQPRDIAITSLDEAFLQKLCDFVESHFEDPELTLRPIEQEFNMTKRQFQRKVRALTDQNPSQFIRMMRLQRAKKLLESNAGSISEIAFQTGFNNLSYFARSFRQHFGHLPSELEKASLK